MRSKYTSRSNRWAALFTRAWMGPLIGDEHINGALWEGISPHDLNRLITRVTGSQELLEVGSFNRWGIYPMVVLRERLSFSFGIRVSNEEGFDDIAAFQKHPLRGWVSRLRDDFGRSHKCLGINSCIIQKKAFFTCSIFHLNVHYTQLVYSNFCWLLTSFYMY